MRRARKVVEVKEKEKERVERATIPPRAKAKALCHRVQRDLHSGEETKEGIQRLPPLRHDRRRAGVPVHMDPGSNDTDSRLQGSKRFQTKPTWWPSWTWPTLRCDPMSWRRSTTTARNLVGPSWTLAQPRRYVELLSGIALWSTWWCVTSWTTSWPSTSPRTSGLVTEWWSGRLWWQQFQFVLPNNGEVWAYTSCRATPLFYLHDQTWRSGTWRSTMDSSRFELMAKPWSHQEQPTGTTWSTSSTTFRTPWTWRCWTPRTLMTPPTLAPWSPTTCLRWTSALRWTWRTQWTKWFSWCAVFNARCGSGRSTSTRATCHNSSTRRMMWRPESSVCLTGTSRTGRSSFGSWT